MSLLRLVWAALLLPFLAVSAVSQQVEDHATVTPLPDWVIPALLDLSPFDMAENESEEILLLDWQTFYRHGQRVLFHHRAIRPKTIEATADLAAVQISFDPAYSRVELHALTVHRGTETRDLLDLSEMEIYRFETERDRLIYNGELELSHLLPDIRVGDVIEYAFSLVGNNPALDPHFGGYAQHQFRAPVRFIRNRAIYPKDADILLKSLSGAPTPDRSMVAEGQVYDWTHRDVPGLNYEDDQPDGSFIYPTSLLTSFADWAAVGKHFAPFYAPPGSPPEALTEITNEIMAQHESKSARARAALAWVQSNVRYLGIELGEGGYIPRGPDVVLARRFGDCKDMVVLLNTMLTAMDIEASPVLVHSEWRGDVALWAPSHRAFDHVITMVTIGGRRFFLDPTRGEQLGDFDNVALSPFAKGVVVDSASPGMIDINVPEPAYLNVFEDFYSPIEDSGDMRFENVSSYYGAEAERMLAAIKDDGLENLEERFLNYYSDYFDQIEQTAPIKVELWEEDAILVLTSEYLLKDAWREQDEDGETSVQFDISTGDLLSMLPDLPDGPRETAFALRHPTRVKHSYEIILDESWVLEDKFASRRLDSFDYHSASRFHRGILSAEITFNTRSDRIDPAEYQAASDALEELRGTASITLWKPKPGWADFDEETILGLFYLYLTLVCLFTLVVDYLRRNDDLEWRRQQVFYPVSVFKFLLLSFASYGLYQLYWSYKNWLWVKEVQRVRLLPVARAFFALLTNFWLFTRIATHPPMPGKTLHFFAIPLALGILLINGLGKDWDPGWGPSHYLSLYPIGATLLYLPVVLRVKWLNRSNGKHTVMNSRIGWPAIALLIFWGPPSLWLYFHWVY